MTVVKKIILWGESEFAILFRQMPAAVKSFDVEALHVCNIIKSALASPEATAIEALLAQLIPGNWEGTTITVIEKALTVSIPELTNIAADSNDTIVAANKFVNWLKTLSPKMAHSGLLKLLSSIFQDIDPNLSEVEADTAAQLVYAKSTLGQAS